MNPRALKYLLDIESVIVEIETIAQKLDNNFHRFKYSEQ